MTTPTVAHIVAGQRQWVADAIEAGTEITALCRHRWVPTLHEPEHLPVCLACVKVLTEHRSPSV